MSLLLVMVIRNHLLVVLVVLLGYILSTSSSRGDPLPHNIFVVIIQNLCLMRQTRNGPFEPVPLAMIWPGLGVENKRLISLSFEIEPKKSSAVSESVHVLSMGRPDICQCPCPRTDEKNLIFLNPICWCCLELYPRICNLSKFTDYISIHIVC